ncbi:MAG: hypothetical protein ACI97X_002247, partial [Oceanospirillaceae bacterium]
NDCWVDQSVSYYIGDSVVYNGHLYHEIRYVGTSWSGMTETENPDCNVSPHPVSGLAGALRAENGIYYVGNSSGEEMIFDFTLEVGDTLQNSFTNDQPLIVDSTDYVDINGKSCKRLFISGGDTPEGTWIVEGIGSGFGPLEPLYNGFHSDQMNCYRENLGSAFPFNTSNCSLLGVTQETENPEFEIHPNPTNSILKISGLTSPTSFSIHNLLGKKVMSGIVNYKEELDVSGLHSGIYILKITEDRHIVSRKFVKL